MINPFLVGDKIYLSPLSENDISDKYINWLNDHEVCKENSHARFPNTRSETFSYIKRHEMSKSEIIFAIRIKKNDQHIGNIAIQNIDYINRSSELAIIIGEKKQWGNGFGSEAYSLLIDYGFNTLNLNRIYSGQTVTNKTMIKVCEKNGMKNEVMKRDFIYKNGKYIDVVIYSILLNDFVNFKKR